MDLRHAEGGDFNQFVRLIANHVRCELGQAVQLEYSPKDPKRALLLNWGASIALTIKADDKSSLDPDVSFVNSAGLFTFSAGGHLGADATREMTMTYFIPFRELLGDPHKRKSDGTFIPCAVHENEPIAGNLRIHQTLESGLETWDGMYTLSESIASGGTWDTITHHVTFEVEAGANANPSLKIVRVNVNPSGTFVSATRTRTDELLITMGPAVLEGKKLLSTPSPALSEAFATERLRSVVNK
ncbi:hypothetical protein FJ950_27045 [Mesorhizobium sp. B2-3-14]|uniref:hypothetical protein n=1 Tax=Mesorhizobium sp. B2-3-14 TaxID=2589950 RepID=UPI0011265DBF|nr:hypothetical protein [Mesorhizobium sp. B2-3-14]TPL79874.1 hypothetical protein FJ950_27045 [Mesorhizobium sp. B2-3-14]